MTKKTKKVMMLICQIIKEELNMYIYDNDVITVI